MLLFSGYLLTSSETSALKSLLAKCKVSKCTNVMIIYIYIHESVTKVVDYY